MKNLFYTLLLLLAGWQQSEGQTIPLILSSPATVAACANNNYRASLPGQGQLQGIRIESAILYNGNTHEACGLIRGSQIVMDSIRSGAGVVITPSNIVSDSGFWSATLPVVSSSDSVVMYYHLIVDCAVIPTNANVNTMQAEQYWRDSIGVFNINNTGTNRDTSTQIKYPFLVNLSSSAYQALFHDTLELSFLFMNTGNATAVAGFTFIPDEAPLCGHADTIGFSYQTGINGSPAPFYANDTFLLTLPTADTLIIKQRVLPTSCLSACTDQARLRWFCAGAQNNGSTLCDSCYGSAAINYSIQNAPSPALAITRLLPEIDSVANFDTSCVNDLSGMREWRYRISTNGNGRLDSACIHLSCHDPLGVNMLSLIPSSTLVVDTFCQSCTVNYSQTLNPNALCAGDIPDPLGYFDLVLHNFGGDDSMIITFKTYQCVEDTDTLFKLAKYFNSWKFEKSYGRGICGDSIPAIMLPTQYASLNIVNQIGAYVNPITYYAPLVTDLSAVSENTMPFDSIWGDSALFSVQWNGYMYETINNALFGCTQNNFLSCTPKGYLRAVIETHTGLGVGFGDSSLQLRYTDSLGVVYYIAPEYFYTNFSDTVCSAGHLTCYFNLETPGVKEALLNGFFDFTLKSCCGGQTGAVLYRVKYYFLLNPTGTCTGLSFPSGDSLPPTCLSTNCEWLPLSRIEDEIVVHCPGCITPGIVISNYNIRRTTYGLQDTNNDGKADVPTTPIVEGNNWFTQHRNQLSTHYASLGDRLEDRLLAYFSSGVYGTGYTYPQLYTQGAVLKHLQLSRLIPAGRDTMQLHVDTLTIYIDTPDTTGLNPCLDCTEYGLSPQSYSTQRKLIMTGNAVYNYIDTSMTNYFLINLTSWDSSGTLIGNLHDATQTVDSSSAYPLSGFFEQQRYRIKTSYSICGNFSQRNDDIITDLEDVRIESEIENKMWLTGYLKPANAFSVYSAQPPSRQALADSGWALPPDTNGTPVDSSFAGHYLFVCEDFGGKLYFFSQDVRNQSALAEKKQDCIKQIIIGSEARIGGNLLNVYPYEYHPSVLQPQEYQVIVPGQYYISAMQARNTISVAGNQLHSTLWLPYSLSDTTGTVVIPDSVFNVLTCLTDTSVTDSLWFYYGNRMTRREIVLDIVPLICTDTLTIYETDSLVKIIASGAHDQCLTTASCAALYTDTIPTLPYEQQEFTTHPNDTVTYIANVTVTSGQICFDFILSNPPVSGQQITYAPNYFMVVPDSLEIPYLTNWTLATTGGQIIPVHDSVFTMDSILDVGEVTTYRLCADFLYCPADTLDSLTLHLGWNCNGYPSKANADSSCFRQEITYLLQFEKSSLIEYRIAATVDTLPYTLCKPFSYTKCFRVASAGDVKPLTFVVEPPQPWLHIESVKAGRDSCSSDTMHVLLQPQAGTYTFAITDTALLSLGYTDTVLYTNDCLCGTVTFRSECDTLGGDLPNITLQGESYCGDSLEIDVKTFYKAVWDGNSECHDCFSITKTAIEDTPNVGDTVHFLITITSINGYTTQVITDDITPAAFDTIGAGRDTLTIPPMATVTDTVVGMFNQTGGCPDLSDTAMVIFAAYDSLNQHTGIDTIYQSYCLNVISSCIDSSTLVIADNTLFSATQLTSPVTEHLYLEGAFIIDQDVVFDKSLIQAKAGASIVILGWTRVDAVKTIFEGCDSLWKGIEVMDDATLNLENENSIRDANEGVFLHTHANLTITNSEVINSIRGILLQKSWPGLYMGHLSITGSTFGMYRPTFKPDYPGQSAHGNIPYAGIDIYDAAAITIGDETQPPNIFHNMNIGIKGFRSRVDVVNFQADSIYRTLYYKSKPDGAAVAFLGDTATGVMAPSYVNVWGTTDILNCDVGVYSHFSSARVTSSRMTNVKTGVYMWGARTAMRGNFSSNSISAKQYGILLNDNNGCNGVWAMDNIIVINGDKYATGILTNEFNTTSQAIYTITGNAIEIENANAGIELNQADKAEVHYNYIEIKKGIGTAPISKGIALQNSIRSSITCNNVKGFVDSLGKCRGYHISLSPNNTIQCNTVRETGYGFYFGGNCNSTTFKGNYMDTSYTGLYLNTEAIIGKQPSSQSPPWNGNSWANPSKFSSTYGAVNMNDSLPFYLAQSLFSVRQGVAPHNPLIPLNAANPPFHVNDQTWFDQLPIGNSFDCASIGVCMANIIGGGDDEYRILVASDSALSTLFIPEAKIIAQQLLYEEIINDSLLLNSDAVYINFVLSKQNTDIDELQDVKSAIEKTVDNNEQYVYGLNEKDSVMDLLTKEVKTIDSLYQIQPDTLLDIQRTLLFQEININNLNIQQQHQSLINTDVSLINQASSINENISTTETPTSNEVLVNRMEIKYNLFGVMAVLNEYENLLQIAFQCPYVGGPSVYRARAMLSLVNDSLSYDDATICSASGIYRTIGNTYATPASPLLIFPNPGKDIFTILLPNELNYFRRIEVKDMLGKVLYKKEITTVSKLQVLHLPELHDAIYTVVVWDERGRSMNGKLIIQR